MSHLDLEWKSSKIQQIFLGINKNYDSDTKLYDLNYENLPFYLDVTIYSQKCKFGDRKYEEIISEFNRGKMKKSQILTMQIKNPGKGL